MDHVCSRCENLIVVINIYPKSQYISYKSEIDKAIKQVLNSGNYILGKEVNNFEKEFSNYIGVRHSIGVASGTDALFLSLRAFDIGYGDEVITVSHTAVATASAIIKTGAVPKFVDINQENFTMDPSKIQKAITKKTRAIIPVHIYGSCANMKEIIKVAKKNSLFVIEDCSQSHGALYKRKKVGSIGDIGCFSFYPTKNIGAIGDAGIITTNNSNIYRKILLLREYGWIKRYISDYEGYNSRLDEIQAAILRVKLKYLDNNNIRRNTIAQIYNKNLYKSNIITPIIPTDTTHVFHLYVIRCNFRDKLKKKLLENGVKVSIQYPVPIHKQQFYSKYISTKLKNTELIAKDILSLPIYPEMQKKYAVFVSNLISDNCSE